ncbi:hypothetical protein C8J57DRAFT_1680331 [Mycena rebaudengoi]|nr:hypothetical protein C8J57DRAFT_1680331 [Mycena rebaudengoi]
MRRAGGVILVITTIQCSRSLLSPPTMRIALISPSSLSTRSASSPAHDLSISSRQGVPSGYRRVGTTPIAPPSMCYPFVTLVKHTLMLKNHRLPIARFCTPPQAPRHAAARGGRPVGSATIPEAAQNTIEERVSASMLHLPAATSHPFRDD